MTIARLQALLNRTLPDARIEPLSLPGCGPMKLGLINADYAPGPLDPEVMRAVIREPAYWAFCWGSGLALARYLTRHPTLVRGRRVVDLGSGSGVVAIAAALAGADRVIACDNDPDALMATGINAELNGCRIELSDHLYRLPADNDLLLMADVLYDAGNLPLLTAAKNLADTLLVADSRIARLPDPAFTLIDTIEARTCPNLGEFDEFRSARLFHWGTPLELH
ncbi:MAG: 50S ribosomal protein L11 methyltransferase [Pseudomonadales bacterium]